MGHCVRLLVPTDNEQVLAPIIGRVVGRWGGVIVSDASGWWTNGNGDAIKDKLSVLECSIGVWDHAARLWWFDIVDVVRVTWKQDSVMLTVHDSDGWFVSGNESSDRELIGGDRRALGSGLPRQADPEDEEPRRPNVGYYNY